MTSADTEKNWIVLLKEFREDLWDDQKESGMCLKNGNIIVLCVSVDDFKELMQNGMIKDEHLFKQSISGIIREVLNDYGTGECFLKEPGLFVGIVNPRSEKEDTLKEACENIQNALKRYAGVGVSIGISGQIQSHMDMPSGFARAKQALDKTFFTGKKSINFYNEETGCSANGGARYLFDLEAEKRLRHAVEFNDFGIASREIKEFISNIFSMQGTANRHDVIAAFDDILYILLKELKLYDKRVEDIPEYSLLLPKEQIRECQFLSDLSTWLNDFLNRYFEYLSLLRNNTYREVVKDAVEYIKSHYFEEITLQKVARYVNMSENYFNHVFKEEVGEGLIEYLTKYRLEKAKELLRSSDLSINSIANCVGYENIYYFSSVFKKVTGMSPIGYRKSSKN